MVHSRATSTVYRSVTLRLFIPVEEELPSFITVTISHSTAIMMYINLGTNSIPLHHHTTPALPPHHGVLFSFRHAPYGQRRQINTSPHKLVQKSHANGEASSSILTSYQWWRCSVWHEQLYWFSCVTPYQRDGGLALALGLGGFTVSLHVISVLEIYFFSAD